MVILHLFDINGKCKLVNTTEDNLDHEIQSAKENPTITGWFVTSI